LKEEEKGWGKEKGVILYEQGSGKREKLRKGSSLCGIRMPPDDV
jgi:hypothetical protein